MAGGDWGGSFLETDSERLPFRVATSFLPIDSGLFSPRVCLLTESDRFSAFLLTESDRFSVNGASFFKAGSFAWGYDFSSFTLFYYSGTS